MIKCSLLYSRFSFVLKSLKHAFMELSTFAVSAYLVQKLCNHFLLKWQAQHDLDMLKLADAAIVIQRFYRSYCRVKMLRRTMHLLKPRLLLNKRIALLKAQSAIDAWVFFTMQHRASLTDYSSSIHRLCSLWNCEDEIDNHYCLDLLQLEVLLMLGVLEIDNSSTPGPDKILFAGRVGSIVIMESPVLIDEEITLHDYPPPPISDVGWVDTQAELETCSDTLLTPNLTDASKPDEGGSRVEMISPARNSVDIVNAHTITLGQISPVGQRSMNAALATSDNLSLKRIKRTTEVMIVNALEEYGKCHVIDGQLMFYPNYDIFGPSHVTINVLTQVQEVNISEAFRLLKKYQGYFPRALCHRLQISPELNIWMPIPGTYWRCTHDDFGEQLPTALVGVNFEPCIEADDPSLAITYSNALLLPHL